jgi:pilus assembly protein CpaC
VLKARKRARVIASAIILAAAPPVAADAASLSRSGRSLAASGRGSMNVSMGNTETMRTGSSYVDLVVGDPDIADAMPLTDRSFYVHGKKLGTTTVSAYDANKNLVGEVEVEVGYNTSRLRQEIKRRLPGSNIEVSSVNGHIMLGGTVTDGVAR